MKPSRRLRRTTGYVATGPGFYVWEEHRGDARRAARDLSPLGVTPIPRPAPPASRRRR
jgi:hypothetical protein